MARHHFLSYSGADSLDFALRLEEALRTGSPPLPVWMDRKDIRLGRDWDDEIVEAIRGCAGLLFVMTGDSVESSSVCKNEWSRALRYKKPVVPLLLHAGVEPPFRLQDRQYVDFTGDFAAAVARL